MRNSFINRATESYSKVQNNKHSLKTIKYITNHQHNRLRTSKCKPHNLKTKIRSLRRRIPNKLSLNLHKKQQFHKKIIIIHNKKKLKINKYLFKNYSNRKLVLLIRMNKKLNNIKKKLNNIKKKNNQSKKRNKFMSKRITNLFNNRTVNSNNLIIFHNRNHQNLIHNKNI